MQQLLVKIWLSIAVLVLSAGLALAAEPAGAPKPTAKTEAAKPAGSKKATPVAKRELVDINSAGDAELRAIPGLGDASIAKIVVNRPYANKAQLVSRKVLPESVYEKIKDRIIAKQPKKTDPKAVAKPEPKKK